MARWESGSRWTFTEKRVPRYHKIGLRLFTLRTVIYAMGNSVGFLSRDCTASIKFRRSFADCRLRILENSEQQLLHVLTFADLDQSCWAVCLGAWIVDLRSRRPVCYDWKKHEAVAARW